MAASDRRGSMAPDDSLLLIHLEDFLGVRLPFSPAVDVMARCSGLCRTIALKYSRGRYSLTFLAKATVGGVAAKGKSLGQIFRGIPRQDTLPALQGKRQLHRRAEALG